MKNINHLLKILVLGLIVVSCIYEAENNSRSDYYIKLALDTARFQTANIDDIDSIEYERLLVANYLLDSAILYDSTNENAFYWKSSFLIHLKKYSIALETADQGIKNYSKRENEVLNRLYILRGALNQYLYNKDVNEDFHKALRWYDKLIENDSEDLEAIINKALVLCYMGRKNDAISYLNSIENKNLTPQINQTIQQIRKFDINRIFEMSDGNQFFDSD